MTDLFFETVLAAAGGEFDPWPPAVTAWAVTPARQHWLKLIRLAFSRGEPVDAMIDRVIASINDDRITRRYEGANSS